MIRKTLIAALALTAAGSVYAQEAKIEENGRYTDKVYYSDDKYKVETNRFWSNWFVSVGGGATRLRPTGSGATGSSALAAAPRFISATTTSRLTSATDLAERSTLP